MADYSEPPPLFEPDDDDMPENAEGYKEEDSTNDRAEVSEIKSTPLESPLKEDKDDLFSDALETEIPLDSPRPERDFPTHSVIGGSRSEAASSKIVSSSKSSAENDVSSGFAAPPSRSQESRSEETPDDQGQIEISVSDPKKVGDGMNAYMVYKVVTKSTLAIFHRTESSVYRRFSDFLGLHEKLVERHQHLGRIIPPPPEKSVLGMTKIKISKEEGSTDFVEKRRASLERFVNHIAKHAVLRADPCFIEFVEKDGDLPKATGTSSLSGAGVMKLFSRVGDSLGKMTFKMDETDQWFEEKQQQIEVMEEQMKKLHAALETLVAHRRELATSTSSLARSTALLANMEEHTGLSRVLSQLAEVEEKLESYHHDQADRDFFVLSELAKDYVGLMGAVKEVFHERVKTFKTWKEAEATLNKKREAKVKLELARKTDKLAQAEEEVREWEGKVEKGAKDFDEISAVVRREVAQFEKLRVRDFRLKIINYLEGLLNNQQQVIGVWEAFLPEVKSIV